MAAPVAAYLIAIGTMFFAGLVALTVVTVVKHLDPPERAAATPARGPDRSQWLLSGLLMPQPPRRRVRRKRLPGDVAQRLEHPIAGLGIERVVFGVPRSRGTAWRRCRSFSMPDCASPHAARSRIIAERSSCTISRSGSITPSVPRKARASTAQYRTFSLGSWIELRMISRARSGLNASIAEQADVPERVGAGALGAATRIRLEPIDRRGTSREPARGDVDFDGRLSHAHVVGVDRHAEERLQLRRRLDSPQPAGRVGEDFLVGATIPVDRSLEQELGLLLRGHRLHGLAVVVGEDRRRRPRRGPLSLKLWTVLRVQRHADRDGSSRKRCDHGGAHGTSQGKAGASEGP